MLAAKRRQCCLFSWLSTKLALSNNSLAVPGTCPSAVMFLVIVKQWKVHFSVITLSHSLVQIQVFLFPWLRHISGLGDSSWRGLLRLESIFFSIFSASFPSFGMARRLPCVLSRRGRRCKCGKSYLKWICYRCPLDVANSKWWFLLFSMLLW